MPPAESRRSGGEVFRQTLPFGIREARGAASGETLELADDLEQLSDILARERRDGHPRLMGRRGDDVALPFETLKRGTNGVRLTPNRSATSVSTIRAPGASCPRTIRLRSDS